MFTEKEKIEAFDLIAAKFYRNNFGQISKADFEVLMFKIYLGSCYQHNKDTSDFTMAVALGITEAKVRNLKVKQELQYPEMGQSWKETFIKSIQYATYDGKNGLVKLSVVDPNVKRNLDHYIEENHLYSETQLNGKNLQMRPDHFLFLYQSLSEELDGENLSKEELLKILKASAENDTLETQVVIEKIKNYGSVKDMMGEVIATCGRFGLKVLLQAIPMRDVLKPFVNVFTDKL